MLRIDTDTIKSLEDKKFYEEKIGNRIVLNFLYTVIAYIALFMFYRYATGLNGMNALVVRPTEKLLVVLFVILAAATVGLYIWSFKIGDIHKKSTVRNHAHMLLLFAIGSVVINFPFYLRNLLPRETTPNLIKTLVQPFRTTQNNYKLVAVLIGVIFVALMVYNVVMYRKVSKITKKAISKKQ